MYTDGNKHDAVHPRVGVFLKSRRTGFAGTIKAACTQTFFFFNDPAPTDISTLPLHDALPILVSGQVPDKSRSTADAKAHNGRAEVIGWAFERANGGRSFAYTGCDLHRNWEAEGQRQMPKIGRAHV